MMTAVLVSYLSFYLIYLLCIRCLFFGSGVSGSDDQRVCVWDLKEKKTIAVLSGHNGAVREVMLF